MPGRKSDKKDSIRLSWHFLHTSLLLPFGSAYIFHTFRLIFSQERKLKNNFSQIFVTPVGNLRDCPSQRFGRICIKSNLDRIPSFDKGYIRFGKIDGFENHLARIYHHQNNSSRRNNFPFGNIRRRQPTLSWQKKVYIPGFSNKAYSFAGKMIPCTIVVNMIFQRWNKVRNMRPVEPQQFEM